ncbi:endoglucanase [Mycena filopes]|nr:endoglucanase [Mycena filopes]
MKTVLALSALAAAISPVASVAIFGQCGGQGYTGSTVCDSGSTCVFVNPFYSQCLAATGTTTPPAPPVTTTSTAPPTSGTCANRTKFKYFGVNQSGAEFGSATWPGLWGKDFIFPAPSSIDYFVGKGFNFFRVPFQMERLVAPATGIAGPLSSAYLANLTATVNYITNTKGAFVALDPHNFMNYNNAPISSTADFQKFWTNLAGQFKSNTKVIFDVMNEPNGIPASTAFALNQAAVNGIRASGAWVSSGNSAVFGAIKDPNNNIAIHAPIPRQRRFRHERGLWIGAERLAAATAWLKANNLKGFLGEMGAGSNAQCISAVSGALCAMQQSGVWIGFSWWAAGPWWPADYFTSIEPPSGLAVNQVLPQALLPYL